MKSLAIGVLAGALVAAPRWSSAQNTPSTDSIFHANETSLDVFGSVSAGQETVNHISKDRIEDNGRLGLGLGVNHFFTRHLGIGGDAYTENTRHSFVDNASVNLIVRFPIDNIHLAPYAYGGGGYQFDPRNLGFGQVGGGVEWRLGWGLGIFTDARYVFTYRSRDIGVGRFGIRLGY